MSPRSLSPVLAAVLCCGACTTVAPPGAERSEPSVSAPIAPAAAPSTPAPSAAASSLPHASSSASAPAPALASSSPFAATPAPVADPRPQIYSKARHAWIHYQPSTSSGWAGWLGLGDSVPLRSDKPVAGDGCNAFYAVEPRGYVCLDRRTTLDPNDPGYKVLRKFGPRYDTPFPHFYGESHGAPRYYTVPSQKLQRQKEYQLDDHLAALLQLREGKLQPDKAPRALVGVDPKPAGHGPDDMLSNVPARTFEEREYVGPGSAIAWTEEFDAEGRTWLVTPDYTFMPKDKIQVYPRVSFKGVHLTDDLKLPIAYVRKQPRPKHVRKDGVISPTGEQWPRFAWVALTGQTVREGEGVYYETRDGQFIAKDDATVVRPAPATPWGAPVDGAQDSGGEKIKYALAKPPGGRRTWIEVSVLGGWMIAYEDTRPIFATLIAPGRGGVPTRGIDPIETASTPVGAFRVDGKFWTGTMVNKAFVHADVPYVLNFHGAHALHMAYWHDNWGEKTSGGCINLSPEDSRWFFLWSEPAIPPGWHGMRSDKEAGPATIVIVHS